MINLLSRLVGAHRLQLPNFFPYLQRYLQPHQRDITLLLAYLVQEDTSPLLPLLESSPHAQHTRESARTPGSPESVALTSLLSRGRHSAPSRVPAQACHELLTAEMLSPLLLHLANHFVTDKSRPEMVAIGLNTTREAREGETLRDPIRDLPRSAEILRGVIQRGLVP